MKLTNIIAILFCWEILLKYSISITNHYGSNFFPNNHDTECVKDFFSFEALGYPKTIMFSPNGKSNLDHSLYEPKFEVEFDDDEMKMCTIKDHKEFTPTLVDWAIFWGNPFNMQSKITHFDTIKSGASLGSHPDLNKVASEETDSFAAIITAVSDGEKIPSCWFTVSDTGSVKVYVEEASADDEYTVSYNQFKEWNKIGSNIKNYEAGKLDFNFEGYDSASGNCQTINFNQEFEFTPFIFTTFQIEFGSPIEYKPFSHFNVWVKEASTCHAQVCVTHSSVSEFKGKIHYVAFTNIEQNYKEGYEYFATTIGYDKSLDRMEYIMTDLTTTVLSFIQELNNVPEIYLLPLLSEDFYSHLQYFESTEFYHINCDKNGCHIVFASPKAHLQKLLEVIDDMDLEDIFNENLRNDVMSGSTEKLFQTLSDALEHMPNFGPKLNPILDLAKEVSSLGSEFNLNDPDFLSSVLSRAREILGELSNEEINTLAILSSQYIDRGTLFLIRQLVGNDPVLRPVLDKILEFDFDLKSDLKNTEQLCKFMKFKIDGPPDPTMSSDLVTSYSLTQLNDDNPNVLCESDKIPIQSSKNFTNEAVFIVESAQNGGYYTVEELENKAFKPEYFIAIGVAAGVFVAICGIVYFFKSFTAKKRALKLMKQQQRLQPAFTF